MKVRYINKWVLVRDSNGKLLSAEFVDNAEVETNNQQEGFESLSKEQQREVESLPDGWSKVEEVIEVAQ